MIEEWLKEQKNTYKERNKRLYDKNNEEIIYTIEQIQKLIRDGYKYRLIMNYIEDIEREIKQ